MDVLGRILKQTEKLLEHVNREKYLSHAGLKDHSNLAPIYDKYKALGCIPSIRLIKTILSQCCSFKQRNLRYLYEFMLDNYLTDQITEINDQILTFQAQANITLDGEEIPFRSSEVQLLKEPNREKRIALDEARKKIIIELNPMLENLLTTSYKSLSTLGFDNYISLYSTTSEIDYYALEQQTNILLERTEEIFTKNLNWKLNEKLGISPDTAKRIDTSFMFRWDEFSELFPQETMIEKARQCTNHMGIDMYSGGNIKFDIEARPRKTSRAFCSTINIPEEIILVIMPQGGLQDWLAFFHELGHSLHYGYTSKTQEMEFKRLGDYSITESYAFLFEHLLLNKYWLQEYLNIKDPEPFLQSVYLWKLYMLRRYASKLSYELILHKDSGTGQEFNAQEKSAAYAEILSRGCKVQYDPEHYLFDLDLGFYSARYLRAWFFESNLMDYLNRTYGVDWFMKPKAGKFLKELWKVGQGSELHEIAAQLGFEPTNCENLISEFNEHLPLNFP